MTALFHLRLAVRTLIRSPLFAFTAIGSLAIGIAASATIFSLADALFLRPRAGLVDESRLVDVGRVTNGEGFDNFGYQALLVLQRSTQFEGLAGFRLDAHPVSLDNGRGGSERAFATAVGANYFDVLGTRAAAGRLFGPSEDTPPDEATVVVLNHAFWTRRFGASSEVVGTSLRLNGRPYTIIGVAEPGFQGTAFIGVDMWVPFAQAPHLTGRPSREMLTEHGAAWHLAVGRLRPGVSRAQAAAELNTLFQPLKDAHPEAYGRWSFALLPSARVPGEFRSPVLGFVGFLFALTGMVLAIACSNVAGMLLARALARTREIATRLAVGAGRAQIVGQLLTESLVLFVLAALGSTVLAWWMLALLESFVPALPMPVILDLRVDLRLLGFALAVGLVTSLVFGLAPALRTTRLDVVTALHGQHGTADRGRMRLRHLLVGAQVALALVLLVTTGLFARALQRAAAVDTGYDGANVRIFTVDTSLAGQAGQAGVALVQRLVTRIGNVGGVDAVATSRMIPLQGGRLGLGALRIAGFTGPRGDDRFDADWNVISPEYFDVLRIPVAAGRAFSSDDRDGRPFVAIVNETFAARAWPGRDPVGQVVQQQTGRNELARPITIVGVVRNANYRSVGESPVPFIYVPLAQQPMSEVHLYVRHAPGRQVSADVARAIADTDPSLPIVVSQSFEEATGIGLLPQRLAASIAGGVGVVGLFLAGLGLYGVMAFHAVQRRREVALRLALGATPRQVRRLLLRQAARVGVMGGLAGLGLAAGAAGAARGLLLGVAPFDAVAFGTAAGTLGVVLLAASWAPARRAASTDPAAALRAE